MRISSTADNFESTTSFPSNFDSSLSYITDLGGNVFSTLKKEFVEVIWQPICSLKTLEHTCQSFCDWLSINVTVLDLTLPSSKESKKPKVKLKSNNAKPKLTVQQTTTPAPRNPSIWETSKKLYDSIQKNSNPAPATTIPSTLGEPIKLNTFNTGKANPFSIPQKSSTLSLFFELLDQLKDTTFEVVEFSLPVFGFAFVGATLLSLSNELKTSKKRLKASLSFALKATLFQLLLPNIGLAKAALATHIASDLTDPNKENPDYLRALGSAILLGIDLFISPNSILWEGAAVLFAALVYFEFSQLLFIKDSKPTKSIKEEKK